MMTVKKDGKDIPLLKFLDGQTKRRTRKRTSTHPKTVQQHRYLDRMREEDPESFERYLARRRNTNKRNRDKKTNEKEEE